MPDITEQLREWSRSLAESIEPIEIERTTSTVAASTPASTSRRWLAVAASIVVLVGGVAAVASLTGGGPDVISPVTNPPLPTVGTENSTTTAPDAAPTTTAMPPTTAPPSTTNPDDRLESWPAAPAQPVAIDDIPLLLPTLPVDIAGVPVRSEVGGGTPVQPVFTQVFVDDERDILLTLQSAPNSIESTPGDLREPIAIDGWDDAFLTSGGDLRLVASDPGGYVRLFGTGMDGTEAARLVADMQRRPDGVPGWDLLAESGLSEVNGAWIESSGQRFVTWFDGTRVVAQMITSPAHTDLISQALSPAFEQIDVNGMTGWLNSNDGRQSIVWSPDGGTFVVLGVADDRIDPLSVAKSLTELTAADYEARTTTEVPDGLGDGCSGSLFC